MALWENVIGYGLHADRPAAGAPGAIYAESDTGEVYRDNGTTWDRIATSGVRAYAVNKTSADLVLTEANTLVVCLADDLHITLPDAAANAGLGVEVRTGSHSGIVVEPAGTDTVDGGATDTLSPGAVTYRSDGADWPRVGVF